MVDPNMWEFTVFIKLISVFDVRYGVLLLLLSTYITS